MQPAGVRRPPHGRGWARQKNRSGHNLSWASRVINKNIAREQVNARTDFSFFLFFKLQDKRKSNKALLFVEEKVRETSWRR